jgi:hypothetical protein
MRQIRISRRRAAPGDWWRTPPPPDARDPAIAHAHQLARRGAGRDHHGAAQDSHRLPASRA